MSSYMAATAPLAGGATLGRRVCHAGVTHPQAAKPRVVISPRLQPRGANVPASAVPASARADDLVLALGRTGLP